SLPSVDFCSPGSFPPRYHPLFLNGASRAIKEAPHSPPPPPPIRGVRGTRVEGRRGRQIVSFIGGKGGREDFVSLSIICFSLRSVRFSLSIVRFSLSSVRSLYLFLSEKIIRVK